MPSVYLDSETNSTMFTTCCRVAICNDQERCPNCRQEVTPKDARGRWFAAYGPIKRKERGYGPYGQRHF